MRPEPAFEAPWHAQLFALTVALNEAGHFKWLEWTDAFSATLKAHALSKDLDGGDDYFSAWLETLETLLTTRGMAEPSALQDLRAAWQVAYLQTPHGQPVRLNPDRA